MVLIVAVAVIGLLWGVDPEERSGTLSATSPLTPAASVVPVEGAPNVTPVPSALPGAPDTVHAVQPGDTLIALAARYYQDGTRWREILEANADLVSDPDNLRVGMELLIPYR